MVSAVLELFPGAALVLARALALTASAPVLGDRDVPHSLRLGLAAILAAALAPLRAEHAPPPAELAAFVPALVAEATSLVLAVIDQPTRQAFDVASAPGCDVDAITDATVKSGKQPSAAFVAALKTWLGAGAPNN